MTPQAVELRRLTNYLTEKNTKHDVRINSFGKAIKLDTSTIINISEDGELFGKFLERIPDQSELPDDQNTFAFPLDTKLIKDANPIVTFALEDKHFFMNIKIVVQAIKRDHLDSLKERKEKV